MTWYFAVLVMLLMFFHVSLIGGSAFECRQYSHGRFASKNHLCKGNPFLTTVCHVTKRNGIAESGCLMADSISECETRFELKGDTYAVCCCEADKCNDRDFIERCASSGRTVKSGGVFVTVTVLLVALVI